MRDLVFEVVTHLTWSTIFLIDKGVQLLIMPLAWFSAGTRKLIADVGLFLMRRIDRERVDAVVVGNEESGPMEELEQQAAELSLLSTASKIRDHAREQGEWTDYHTDSLNAIGSALVNECDWDSEHVHRYMRDIVGTIPGLEYQVDDSEE